MPLVMKATLLALLALGLLSPAAGAQAKAGETFVDDTSLPTYLEALLDTGDLDAAIDKAFAGVDWDALESAWKTFIEKQL